MPRQPRYRLPGVPQYIACRGHNGATVFEDPGDYRVFRCCLEEAAADAGCDIHAYALLPTEAHLLVTPSGENDIARLMQSAGRRYGRYYNSRHRRRGALWDGRYRAALVQAGVSTLIVYAHIDGLPERVQLTCEATKYRWSSARANRGLARDALLTPHVAYRELGQTDAIRQARYARLAHRYAEQGAFDEVAAVLRAGLVFGSDLFKDDIAHKLNLRVRPGQPGRPKKTPSPRKGMRTPPVLPAWPAPQSLELPTGQPSPGRRRTELPALLT